LLRHPAVRAPFLAGLRAPTILLPAVSAPGTSEPDATALRSVLAHELAHLARGDCWWNLLGRLACALAWAQPLLWVVCRRLEQSSEEVCDLEVLRQGC